MKDFKIYISIASLALILYLVAQFNKPVPISWQPTLYYNDKVPFGSYILYRQLPHLFPGAKVINTNQGWADQFHENIPSNTNYFILAKFADMNKSDFTSMVKYIKSGNSVFISAMGWKGKLADTLDLESRSEYQQKNIGINFTNPKLKRTTDYKFDRDINIEYFSNFDTTHAVVLAKNELGHSNLLRFDYGKGSLYVCSTPLLFTNFGLLNKQGADYAAKALSYLPATDKIYWDEFQNGDILEDISPMRVFFSHPSLQWAYYISLFGLLIFVLYEMKRRQRIIPIIEPLKNSTVDFVNVVGQVYYEQRNNQNIADKKILYFLEHLRTEYYLKTNTLDREFTETLSKKTGIELSFAKELVSQMAYIAVQKSVTDRELILLNQLIEQFYTQSK